MSERSATADPAWWQIGAVLVIFAITYAGCRDMLSVLRTERDVAIEFVRERGYREVRSSRDLTVGRGLHDPDHCAQTYAGHEFEMTAVNPSGETVFLYVCCNDFGACDIDAR